VSTTRCPFAPEGDLSEGISITVNTPRNSTRFGCPFTSGIAIAMLFNSIISLSLLDVVILREVVLREEQSTTVVEGSLHSFISQYSRKEAG
jgi:hypothetical protein